MAKLSSHEIVLRIDCADGGAVAFTAKGIALRRPKGGRWHTDGWIRGGVTPRQLADAALRKQPDSRVSGSSSVGDAFDLPIVALEVAEKRNRARALREVRESARQAERLAAESAILPEGADPRAHSEAIAQWAKTRACHLAARQRVARPERAEFRYLHSMLEFLVSRSGNLGPAMRAQWELPNDFPTEWKDALETLAIETVVKTFGGSPAIAQWARVLGRS
jgi:hypothetical protein